MPSKRSLNPARQVMDEAESEREFQGNVLALARMNGWKVRFDWTRLHSPAGYPDLTLVRGETII